MTNNELDVLEALFDMLSAIGDHVGADNNDNYRYAKDKFWQNKGMCESDIAINMEIK